MILAVLILACGTTFLWSLVAAWYATTPADALQATVLLGISAGLYSALAIIDTLHRLARARPTPDDT